MGPLWLANIIVLSTSFMIFLIVTISYVRSYTKTKAKAFGSIIAFSAILMLESLLSVIIYYTLSLRFNSDLASLLLTINAISLVGYLFLYRSLTV
ncbi:MAG: hypothetical protein M1476_00080 [Candidatus Thermoplasmatota archaeon]|nr:hypothetical protein [Candidatus Thermoplasmatota archaeon]